MPRFSKSYPKRGEIFIADLNPGFKREIHKKRPVLIISSDTINKNMDHAVIIPFSSIVPTLISPEIVNLGKLKGFTKDSVLLPIFIRSIDQDRLIEKIGKLSKKDLGYVESALNLILGLSEIN